MLHFAFYKKGSVEAVMAQSVRWLAMDCTDTIKYSIVEFFSSEQCSVLLWGAGINVAKAWSWNREAKISLGCLSKRNMSWFYSCFLWSAVTSQHNHLCGLNFCQSLGNFICIYESINVHVIDITTLHCSLHFIIWQEMMFSKMFLQFWDEMEVRSSKVWAV